MKRLPQIVVGPIRQSKFVFIAALVCGVAFLLFTEAVHAENLSGMQKLWFFFIPSTAILAALLGSTFAKQLAPTGQKFQATSGLALWMSSMLGGGIGIVLISIAALLPGIIFDLVRSIGEKPVSDLSGWILGIGVFSTILVLPFLIGLVARLLVEINSAWYSADLWILVVLTGDLVLTESRLWLKSGQSLYIGYLNAIELFQWHPFFRGNLILTAILVVTLLLAIGVSVVFGKAEVPRFHKLLSGILWGAIIPAVLALDCYSRWVSLFTGNC